MPPSALSGVFPVLATPFDADGRPDTTSFDRLVDYLIRCGVDGITFPGVASEVGTLTSSERSSLTRRLLDRIAGRVPVIAGASSNDPAATIGLATEAMDAGATALMIAVPPDRPGTSAQVEFFAAVARSLPRAPIMLQNVPPPAGAGLTPEAVLEVLVAVPTIRYVKEETLPSGQRLTVLRDKAPPTLAGVFGGAGGRYITDELRRGAAGTMPAMELAEVHVALFAAQRSGDHERVRELFTRMLPILNVQAVFRWSLTKYVLMRRGLVACDAQRAAGPRLDALDKTDVDAFLVDIEDLLLAEFPVA